MALDSKKLLLILLLILMASSIFTHPTMAATQVNQSTTPQALYFFYADGCGPCEEAKTFMLQVSQNFSALTVYDFEIHNSSNYNLMTQYYNYYNITNYTWPVIFIGNQVLIGLDEIESNVVNLLLNGTGIQQNATLSMQPSAPSVTIGSNLTLSVALTPTQSGTVTIWESINGSVFAMLNAANLTSGAYSLAFNPSALGSYQFYASWPGDLQYTAANSSTITVSVTSKTTSSSDTLYIVLIVIIIIIIIVAAYYMITIRPKNKPIK